MPGLPNPGMDFTAFDVLPASSLDDLVENIEALAAGTGLNNNAVPYSALANASRRLGLGRNSGTTLTTSYVTHATVTATSQGGVCEAEFDITAANANSGVFLTMDVQVLCDGVAITPASKSYNLPFITGATPFYSYHFIMSSTPSAASHTWDLQIKCSSGSAGVVGDNLLKIIEHK